MFPHSCNTLFHYPTTTQGDSYSFSISAYLLRLLDTIFTCKTEKSTLINRLVGFFSSVSSFGLFGVSFCTGVRTETKRNQPLDENNMKAINEHTNTSVKGERKYELVKGKHRPGLLSTRFCFNHSTLSCLLHLIYTNHMFVTRTFTFCFSGVPPFLSRARCASRIRNTALYRFAQLFRQKRGRLL